jgi:hypothetical protein
MAITLADEAVIIWPVLAYAAQMQRTITYDELQGFTGILKVGLGRPLKLIYDYCADKNYPPLNVLVVSGAGDDVGFPGDAYPGKANISSEQFLVQQAKVFAFNWSGKDKPRSENFELQSATAKP